jgi:4-hydroxy-tetrahydrodipicolinate synthase
MSAFTFSGVIPILATPFADDESLDLESLDRLVRFNFDVGVDGVTLLGLLGESNRLTDSERARIIRAGRAAAGAGPVIVGASHTGTAATVDLCRQAAELGANAVMITPLALPVSDERAIFEFYRRVAAHCPLPIVLQDHPAISQVFMSAELILRLVREIPAICCIKAESVPSPPKIEALKRGMQGGRAVPVLTGLGALYGLFDLDRGSDGFNTGFAFPEVLIAILRAHRAGRPEVARALYTRFLPLLVFEQQPGVAIRKEIMRRRGLLATNRVRHPGATADPATSAQLQRLLESTFPGADLTRPLTALAVGGTAGSA